MTAKILHNLYVCVVFVVCFVCSGIVWGVGLMPPKSSEPCPPFERPVGYLEIDTCPIFNWFNDNISPVIYTVTTQQPVLTLFLVLMHGAFVAGILIIRFPIKSGPTWSEPT